MSNVDFARENENFAQEILSELEDRKNWVVTVRFYSLLHYVEERLQAHGYNSRSHEKRKDNIRDCRHVDNKVRKLYRRLEDVSRDARYECIRMGDDDVRKSEETLEEGKRILGFSAGSGGTHKYST